VTETVSAGRLVVITRPVDQAELLAERLKASGRQAILFPLLEIHPLENTEALKQALAGLSEFAMVAFVSPNAIDAAFAAGFCCPDGVALAVMGEGSRAALAKHGLTDVNARIFSPQNAERTDSETLLESLDLPSLRGRKVLIVRGESGRELLAEQLRQSGVQVTQVAAYRRSAPQLTDARRHQLAALLAEKNDWIVTSSEALRYLNMMSAQIELPMAVVKMQQQRLYVPHLRIAETARALGFLHVTVTGSGDEGLLAALQFEA